jgi:hypothetical protein
LSRVGPGAGFRLPTNESDHGDAAGRNIAYAFIRDLAQRPTDAVWQATFRFDRESPIQKRRGVVPPHSKFNLPSRFQARVDGSYRLL